MKIPKLRWIIAIMLFLATSINYADRLALSVVSSDLRAEFHMTERDYSYVVTAFLIACAVMYAGSGYVVDRLGTLMRQYVANGRSTPGAGQKNAVDIKLGRPARGRGVRDAMNPFFD